MRRTTALLMIVATATFLVPAKAGPPDEHRRRWPTTRCRAEPHGRPTILRASFEGKTDYASWRYDEARDALKAAGVPREVFRRNGRRLWDGFAQAGGVAGRLVPAGQRLRRYEPPRRLLRPPRVSFECAGHKTNSPTFLMQIPADIHAREVVKDHGGRERNVQRIFRYEGTRWWSLRRRPRSGTVQRMLIYMRDERVFTIEMNHSGSVTPS